jgi:hypothetical protein
MFSKNIERNAVVENVYLTFYKKKWKQSTAMTNVGESRITNTGGRMAIMQ